jgi:hypothetical protein
MLEHVDAHVLDSDNDTDDDEYCDEGPQLVEPDGDEYEFGNIELENLMLAEGPHHILQLILQGQVDDFMEEETIDANDYANWIKWVSNVEERKHAIFESTSSVEGHVLLQVHQTNNSGSHNNCNEQLTLSDNHDVSTRWKEICQKIRVDNNLDGEKGQ